MSFFEEDDEPTRRSPRPRRAAPAGGLDVDQQTLWTRRAIAAGLGVLIFILLVVAIGSCRSNARKNGLKDFNREVSALVEQSDRDVGANFFEALQAASSESAEDLQSSISSFRVQSETLLEQAEKISTPGDMESAQRSLLIALELRRDGLDFIAKRVTTALGDQGDAADTAIEQIAGQMQAFLASDVLIQARVTPLVKKALDDAQIGGQPVVATAGFLPDLQWLQPEFVATQLDTKLSEGGTNRKPTDPPAPGLHGNGLVSVSVGDVTLQPGTANRIPLAGGPPTFAVKFANQGENDEFDVKVTITLTGVGKAIRASKTVDTIVRGQEATANLALPRAPVAGQVYTVKVLVTPVPGEEKTDNNEQTYNVLFTQ